MEYNQYKTYGFPVNRPLFIGQYTTLANRYLIEKNSVLCYTFPMILLLTQYRHEMTQNTESSRVQNILKSK